VHTNPEAPDRFWSRAEIEAWAAWKPLVDRAYVRRGLYLGDGAWEELFGALRVPTLLLVPPDSPMAPRQEAVHNDLVRTVLVPTVPATASAATSPPGTSGPSTRSSPRWRGHSRPRTRRHSTKEALPSRWCRQFESDAGTCAPRFAGSTRARAKGRASAVRQQERRVVLAGRHRRRDDQLVRPEVYRPVD